MSDTRTDTAPILAPGVWTVDPDHSNVEFVARHMLSRVRGRFTGVAGSITVDPDHTRSSVHVIIQAASINTNHDERDQHLRSADFLHADRYPSLEFRSTSVSPLDTDSRFTIEGELTIRDITRAVVLDAEFLGSDADPWDGRRAAFSARTEIDRFDFGASWNVVLESGGLLVGRRVLIEIEVEAIADGDR